MNIVEALRLQFGESFVGEHFWHIFAAAGQILRQCDGLPKAFHYRIKGHALHLDPQDKAALDKWIFPILAWKNSAEADADKSSNLVAYRAMLGFDRDEMALIVRIVRAICIIPNTNRPSNLTSKIALRMGPYLHLSKCHDSDSISKKLFSHFYFKYAYLSISLLSDPLDSFELKAHHFGDIECYVKDLERAAATTGAGLRPRARRGRKG